MDAEAIKFAELQVGAVDDDEEEDIAAVNDEANDGVVRVTVDSGAARSVWPRRKKGVLRRKLDKKPKLAGANGTKIEVYGEAVLEFEENGKQCGMRFLDSDVKKPLAAVSAMNDEGNTVVFSKKWESYVENDATGKKIMIERVGDTFEITLQTKKMKDGTRKEVSWAEDGGKKYEGMDVDANDEDEDMLKEMTSGKSSFGGFQEADVMRSQGDGELVQHRKTDQNKEDVEEDEDEEYGVRRSVKKFDPREPSKEEREEHEKTHLPFRNWCRHCVRGRGKEEACRDAKRDQEVAEVHLDFMFMGDEGEDRTLAVLVVKERSRGMVMSTVAGASWRS